MDNDISYDMKSGLPNKMINDNGTVTDLLGKTVANPIPSWESKPALPNKWLNPDGTYSTLKEIITEAVDTDIFVIVDELPEQGEPSKIYLVPNGDGHFIEYLWVNNKWDAVGMIEFDLSKYSTTDEMNQAILVALNTAKEYADSKLREAKAYTDEQIANIPQDPEFFYTTSSVGGTNVSSGTGFDFWKNLYDPTNNNPFIVCYYNRFGPNDEPVCYTWYFPNHNFENGKKYIGYSNRNGEIVRQTNNTQVQFGNSYVIFNITGSNITSISGNTSTEYKYFLETDVNYSQAYVPTAGPHPATKKYVDDSGTDLLQEAKDYTDSQIQEALGGEY